MSGIVPGEQGLICLLCFVYYQFLSTGKTKNHMMKPKALVTFHSLEASSRRTVFATSAFPLSHSGIDYKLVTCRF